MAGLERNSKVQRSIETTTARLPCKKGERRNKSNKKPHFIGSGVLDDKARRKQQAKKQKHQKTEDSKAGIANSSTEVTIPRFVLSYQLELLGNHLENLVHRSPQRAKIGPYAALRDEVTHVYRVDARLHNVSMHHTTLRLFKPRQETYLDPANLMIQEVDQKVLRHLSSPLPHPV